MPTLPLVTRPKTSFPFLPTDIRSGVKYLYQTRMYGRYQSWLYQINQAYMNQTMADIFIRFSTLDVSIDQEAPLVDFDTFLSGVGGGLGLFLGFSIIDTLLFLYQYFSDHNIFRSSFSTLLQPSRYLKKKKSGLGWQ